MELMEGYTSSKKLAKDLVFAMVIAPSIKTVSVTDIKGYGWHISAEVSDLKMARAQVRSMIGKIKYDQVSWQ